MRRRLTRAVLFLGFLSVSAFAQTTQTVRGAQFLYFEPSRTSMGWSSVSVGEFWSASNNRTETEGLTAGTNSCLRANSLLQEVIVWDRDPLDPRIVPIWQLPENSAFLFISRMTIDADGAPNAYSRDDRGLDDLSNAGAPGRWNGIVTDKAGDPLLQRPDDPFPGYYISCTSLSDETKKFTDPTGYVDASKIPYVALPREIADRGGARLGDFALVINLQNHRASFAIYADIGTLGEGSIALANALGISSDARRGGQSDGILYLLFPGSGNLRPRTVGEIQREGERLLSDWRGIKSLSSCVDFENHALGSGSSGPSPTTLHKSLDEPTLSQLPVSNYIDHQ